MKNLESTEATLRLFLRSLAFRFKHVTDGAAASFGDFAAGQDVRTPVRIVRHMTVMLQFVHQQVTGIETARLEPLDWQAEKDRFIASVTALDKALAEGKRPTGEVALWQLWQGQLIDAMTHVGQLAMLRRLAGSPVTEGVRYWQVDMPALND